MAPAGTVGLELVPCNFLEFSLLEWTKAVQNAAVGQNGLHAHHGSVQVAISDEPQSPGVGGDVAADVTASLRPEVQRHHQPVLGAEGRVEPLEDDARLDGGHGRVGVDALDLVHPGIGCIVR